MGAMRASTAERMRLMRVVVFLAVGCLAITNGSTEEHASVHDLGDSVDYDAGFEEKQIEQQVQEEDPSLVHYDINAKDQEDRIGGMVDFGEEQSHPKKEHTENEDTMQKELHAIQNDNDGEKEPSLIGEAESEEPEKKPQTEQIAGASDDQEKGTKGQEKTTKESDKATEIQTKDFEKKEKGDEVSAKAKA